MKMNRLLFWGHFGKVLFSGQYSLTLERVNGESAHQQTIRTRSPNVTGHNCPITEAIWHMHNGPVRQASNMAATQKPQHILGTTVTLCSQGGLGKGGVPSLESHSPNQRRSTVRHFHEDGKSGPTVEGYISLKQRKWRSLSKLWEVFNLWYKCLLFGVSSGWLLISEVWAKSV